MHHVRVEDLPLRGSSRNFVGADQGGTGISVFLFHGQLGSGPGPHRHPYDEVQFIQQGRGIWTVNGREFEAGPATCSSSRPARYIPSAASRRHWCRLTCT